MSSIDVKSLAKEMLQAALAALGPHAPKVESYARTELLKIAQTVAGIQVARERGDLSHEQAEALLEMQKNASQSVLATVEGMGLVAAEQAVNAALAVGRTALERTIGLALI